MRIVLPDKPQEEQDRLAKAFFDQYNDDDEIPDGTMDAYFREHASKEYLDFMEELDRRRVKYGEATL